MTKRVLVTGGAGFIGSFLCERLIQEGHDVICLDNFFTGRKRNLSQVMSSDHFEVIRHDVINPILLEVDWIFNLACPASPIHYQYNPVKTIKTNVLGMLNMLGLAKRINARLLQASTSEVYGDPQIHPQSEDYWGNVNPIGIRSCYDEGKRVAETLLFDYKRQSQVDGKVIRIFNTYGPRMSVNDGRVVSNFIIAALQGRDLEVYGDGSQTRSFCYVSDLVEGILRMMQKDDFAGPVNLGNPGEFTVLELAELVLNLSGSSSKIRHLEAREDDPLRRKPNIELAQKKLDWKPNVSLQVGLKHTIDYFRKII